MRMRQSEETAKKKGLVRIMLDFEQEIARFKPSLEVSEVEAAIVREDLTDMNDLMMEFLKEKKQ